MDTQRAIHTHYDRIGAQPPIKADPALGSDIVETIMAIMMGACSETARIVARSIVLRHIGLLEKAPPVPPPARHPALLEGELKRQIVSRAKVHIARIRAESSLSEAPDMKSVIKALSSTYPGQKIGIVAINNHLSRRKEVLERMFPATWLWERCAFVDRVVADALSGESADGGAAIQESLEKDSNHSATLAQNIATLLKGKNAVVPPRGGPQSLAHHTDAKAIMDELHNRGILRRSDAGTYFLSARYGSAAGKAQQAATRAAVAIRQAQADLRAMIAMRASRAAQSVPELPAMIRSPHSPLARALGEVRRVQGRRATLHALDRLVSGHVHS